MPASVSPRAQWFARMRVTLGALLLTLVAASALVVSGSGTPAAAQLSCAQGGTCALGDIGPGGGVVFFVKGAGAFDASRTFPAPSYCYGYGYGTPCPATVVNVSLSSGEQAALPFDYLEVAPQSAERDLIWSWGPEDVPGARNAAIGTGEGNSQAIVLQPTADNPLHHGAAYALSYSNNGLDDWFMPSIDELELILVRQAVDGTAMGAFNANMWSSTEVNAWVANHLEFTTGSTRATASKHAAAIGVRPIRSFSAAPPAPTTTTTAAAPTTATAAQVTTTTAALTEAGVAPLPTRSLGVAATVQGGQEVTVRGSGFAAGALIDVYVASEPILLGRVTANLDGTFALDVTLPSGLSGAHSIVVYDPTTGTGFRQSIQIEGNSLAITGGTNDGLMLALGLLMAGAACTVVARRRTITD
jgi:LPXTG-motif cell wall-anchored protein